MGERTANVQPASIADTLDYLANIIHERRDAAEDTSYTARLLNGKEDKLLGKLVEEAVEVVMAAKDRDHDHLRYELADVLYHLLVICECYGVNLDELAGELDARKH